jgi:von Willebrand factor type A domain
VPAKPTAKPTPKLSSRPWRYAITMSAALHTAVLVAAALFAFQLRTSVRHADALEAAWSTPEAGDLSSLQTAQVIEVPPTVAENKSPAAQVGPAQGLLDGQLPVAGPDNRSSRIRLAAHAQPLGSQWLSDSRSRGGLADIVGSAIGLPGSGADGDGAGASGRGGGRKATFFGLGAAGRRIVYVVDASSSMNRPYAGEAKTRFGQMKLELAKSILALTEEQQFFIIFFNEHPIPMPAVGMENAYPQNQQRFLNWIAAVPAAGLTDPRLALTMAINLRPDVVYLLTDGTFPRDVQSDLRTLRQSVVELNTIAFGDPRAEKSLKPLSVNNGGRFVFVP